MRTVLAACLCVLVPTLAFAQIDAPRVPRNDVTLSTGWVGTRQRHFDTYTRWSGSLFGGLNVGHYWTDNLKTDVEAGWLSTTRSHPYETITLGTDRGYVQSDYVRKDLKLSVSQIVQFGRHAWVHPFLGAGVELDYLRTTEDRAPQEVTVYGTSGSQGRRVLIPGIHEQETNTRAVPFGKGGFKIYLSDRTFVVQEFKVGLTSGFDHVLWKTGVGIDF
jgi:opacity protein-like surface antigen